jgi:VCBS repeat-containing protein
MVRKIPPRTRLETLEPRILFSADLPMALPLGNEVEFHQSMQSQDHQAIEAVQTVAEARNEIVFVDTATPNFDQLVDDIYRNAELDGRTIELVLLASDSDGLEQIGGVLADRSDVDAVHIISHGADGIIRLGNAAVDLETLQHSAQTVAAWGESLSADADLLIYGCDLASGPEGERLVSSFALLTGADVSASVDATGHQSLGGDWELEYSVGSVETSTITSQQASDQWLATLAVSATNLDAAQTYEQGVGGPLIPIVVSGSDSGTVTATLSMSDLTAGYLTTGTVGSTTSIFFLGFWTASGPEAEVNALLAQTSYVPHSGSYDSTFGIFTQVNDGASPLLTGYKPMIEEANADVLANGDAYLLNEDASITTISGVDDLLQNDVDTVGAGLSIDTTPVSGPANGTLTMNADGTFTYTPDANFNGTDSFVYSVSDGNSNTAEATVTLTVNALNDPPLASGESYTLDEDSTFTATLGVNDLLQNDTDLDGDVLTVETVPVAGPASGSLVLNSDGSFTYTPIADFNGTDSFTYSVSDGNGGTAQGTVTLTVNPVNDAPVVDSVTPFALTDVFHYSMAPSGNSIDEIIASYPGGFTDVDLSDGQGIAITGVDNSNGRWEYSTNNGNAWTVIGSASDTSAILLSGSSKLVRFIPDPGFTGTATLTFRGWDMTGGGSNGATGVDVSNNGGQTAFSSATGSIAVNSVSRGTSLFVATNDDVTNSGRQDLKGWSAGSILGISEIQTEPGTSDGTLTLLADFDSFAGDGDVNIAGLHRLDSPITIGTNQTVTLQRGDFLFTTAAAETLTGNNTLTFNAGDVIAFRPDSPGDMSSGTFIHVLDSPGTGTTMGISLVEQTTLIGDTVVSSGTLLFTESGGDGIYHYSIDEAGAGTTLGTSELLIDFDDISPGFSDDVTGLHLISSPVFMDPFTLAPGTLIVSTSASGTIQLGDNATSVTSDDLVILTVTTTSMGASGSSSADATVLFEGRDAKLEKAEEHIRAITLVGGDGHSILAGDDSYTLDEDNSFSATLGVDDLLLNDTDEQGDPLLVDTTPVIGPTNGTLILNTDGTFTYTPDPDFNGNDGFVYRVSDGSGGSAVASVTLTVNPVNDDPVAADDAYTLNEDITFSATLGLDDLLLNDSDVDGDILTVNTTPVSGPANGSLTLNADGTFTYSPNANFNGTDSFIYSVSDGNGGTAQATVTLTVNPVNDDPAAVADSYTLDEDTTFSATLGLDDLLRNDSDLDGDILTVNTTPVSGPANGTLVLNADGTFTYTPDANFNGTDSFIYSVSDGNGGTAQATVTMTVNPLNDDPVAMDDAYTLDEDTSFTALLGVDDLLRNDSDLDGDGLIVDTTPVNGPANGTLILNTDGTFSYTPDANFNGTDSFVYSISDGSGGTAQATVTLTVNPVNDEPVAMDDAYTLDEDTNFSATLGLDDLLLNDSDLDGDILTVNTSPVSAPANGSLTLNADGTFTYTPDANFNGTDSFVYSISDGNGGTAQATVTLTVNPVNDDPVAVADAYTLDEDTTFSATLGLDDLLLNDSDLDGDSLTVNTTPVSGPTNGSLTLNADGTFTYTPNANFNGTDSFVYSISDGSGGTAQATVTLTVNPINDDPVAQADSFVLNEDSSLTAVLGLNDLLGNDSDLDGDDLTVTTTPVSGPANGTLTLNADGTFTYTPNVNFNGTDSFVYSISDGSGGTAQATVTLTVNPVNDDPAAMNDAYTLDEDTSLTAVLGLNDLLGNDSDLDGDSLTVTTTPVSGPANGILVMYADGTFTYTPDANFNGTDSFIYSVSDGNGGTAQAMVNLAVNPVNDAPVMTSYAGVSAASENVAENNQITGRFTATDVDGDTLVFSVSGGADGSLFSVDPTTGALRFNLPPNFESPTDTDGDNQYQVVVRATDPQGASVQQSMTVTVFDINEAPVAQDQSVLLQEPPLEGDVITQVAADDEDAADVLRYAIVGGNGMPQFEIDSTTGIITASSTFGTTEIPDALSLQIQVTDSAGATASATVRIGVEQSTGEPQTAPDDTTVGTSSTGDSGTPTGNSDSESDSTAEASDSGADETGTSEEPQMAPEASGFFEGRASDREISFDPEPLEPHSQVANLDVGATLERGYKAVLEILFDDKQEGDDLGKFEGGFGLHDLRFDARLGRLGGDLFEGLSFDASSISADIGESDAIAFQAAAATGLSLSVGFVAWFLRTGALMAGLFAARPLWQGFDPMPVLKNAEHDDSSLDREYRANRESSDPLIGDRFDR